MDRKDGSFIVRYKLYNTCDDFKIDLRYDNMPINGFPKIFKNRVLHDECNCPQNVNVWLKNMGCKEEYDQITSDLNNFKSVKFSQVKGEILKRIDHPGSMSICHYVVRSNQVYRNCYGEYVGFKVFMDSILLSLARKIKLPDMEFLSNLGDWPLERKSNKSPLPIFSWCGSETTNDIIMPTYDLTEATLECMGR